MGSKVIKIYTMCVIWSRMAAVVIARVCVLLLRCAYVLVRKLAPVYGLCACARIFNGSKE